ncbi:MAG: tetratricopeptide repeat protein, partial [Rhodothermales bacterium]
MAASPVRVGYAQAVGAGGADADSLYRAGDDLLNAGRYEEARNVLRSLLDETPHHDGALDYAQTFLLTGAYEVGVERLAELIAAASDAPRLYQARGRLLVAVGRYEEAESDFREALTLKNDLWTGGVDIAELFARTGRDRQAQSIYRTVYQQYKQGTFRTAHTLTAGARAAAEVGEFRDANEAFRTAFRLDGQDVDNLYFWAELFRTKYNEADATRTFEDALRLNERHAPSLIGLARLSSNFERKEELAGNARSINPNAVDALTLLAGLRVLDGQYDEAEVMARRALQVNPASISALAQLASVHHLRGDTAAFKGAERRALEVDPQASDFYLELAENATLRFRYVDAASFARRAVEVNRTDLQARAELGTALLRLGQREEARRHLEAAFDGDPFNLYASNMLTLLDGYENFSTLESEHFRLLIHDDERDVLGADMLAVAEESFDSLRARYPYEPSGKILIEAYGDADDFAVRIAGVPHRGLLGVSFGDVLAVNTPRAQTGRPYNWARTLWHEIAHTMAMGVSENNVPRWFTEGLSVYEEQRARPEWAREMDLGFFSALERDLLLPLEQIDRGFTRPSFPGQIQLSYYHAGRLVKYVADTYGFEAIVDMLHALREGASDEEALAQATGADVAEIDRGFLDAMRREANAARQALEGLPDVLGDEEAEITSESIGAARGPFFETLREGGAYLADEQYGAAETAFQRALSMYDGYVGPGNAYEGLASVYRAMDNEEALV